MMSVKVISVLSCLFVIATSSSVVRDRFQRSAQSADGVVTVRSPNDETTTQNICPPPVSLVACRNECRSNGDCGARRICCPNSCNDGTCIQIQASDSCTPISCLQQGTVCSVSNGVVSCNCITICADSSDGFSIVASDGNTYTSKCHMDRAACIAHRTIRPIPATTLATTTRSPPTPTRHMSIDEEVYRKCHENLEAQSLRCMGREVHMRTYFVYDRETATCERRRIVDCSEVLNKYNTLEECTNTCLNICQQPMSQGECRNYKQRMFYNTVSRRCEVFIYGGCGGNTNNFPDINVCKSMCVYPGPSFMRPPQCRRCEQNLGITFCDADFVVGGRIKRVNNGRGYRYIQLIMTRVFKDRGGRLGLGFANLSNPEEAEREFELDLDTYCPCPDLKHLAHEAALQNRANVARLYHNSRRIFNPRHDFEIIISGMVRYDIPTITQGSLAVLATRENLLRMNGNVRQSQRLCQFLAPRTARRFQQT
ncbi:WAP, Kazal, immunoglobulin, Kunitz and NTR domain-containing protein 2-like [Ciona intestinalis]